MRILFVSSEDRCRGPIARAVADRLAHLEMLDGVVFDSCGVEAKPGEPPTLGAAAFMKTEKINLLNHRAKQINEPLADGADVIFCMTRAHVARTRQLVGEYYSKKVVLLNEGIDLATKNMDIDPPADESVAAMRRMYAAISASMGRLVRTLSDPGCTPEYFGAKSLPKKHKPGTAGAGPRATESTLDPEKRLFLANQIFDLLERAFEPHTTAMIHEAMRQRGHELSMMELEELLRQDLHNAIRIDKDKTWHVLAGAQAQRREKAKAEARARAEQARSQQRSSASPPPPGREERMTESLAYETLGVTASSTADDAQKKYRALLKRYHPDKFHDDPEFAKMAEEKTKRINEAWRFLKDKLDKSDGNAVDDEEIVV